MGLPPRGSKLIINGHNAVFYNPTDPETEYHMFAGTVGRIMPGAFDTPPRSRAALIRARHSGSNSKCTMRASLQAWTALRSVGPRNEVARA